MAIQAKANTPQQLNRLPRQRPLGPGLQRGLAALALFALLWGGYLLAGRPVTLVINGQPHPMRTHYATVGSLVQAMGLALNPEDIIRPPLDGRLAAGDTVTIRLARPVTIEADGHTRHLLTHRQSVGQILNSLGLVLNPRDEIFVNGQKTTLSAQLPPAQPAPTTETANSLFAATTPRGAIISGRPQPTRLTVHRAVPVTLHDGPAHSTFYTARPTVSQALQEQGITLFAEDRVTPGLNTPLSPGMRIYIERSTPVSIVADGRTIQTRTHQKTVGQVLAQQGIALMGQDFSRPPVHQEILADTQIEIVRVRETFEIEEEFIPFETKWVPDDTMPLDQREVRQPGQNGVIKTRTRVRYENGQEIWREVEDEWLAQEPNDHLIAYGTQITIRTLETEHGPIEYWRKIPMLTTAYSAATSGKAPDHPRYGITRSGLEAGYGIVAVDPKVIPLMTEVYVPGYGPALAGDTGGGVLGKHIDLGYNENPPLIYEWRDVYVLTPVPPPNEIRYVLPQWPQQ